VTDRAGQVESAIAEAMDRHRLNRADQIRAGVADALDQLVPDISMNEFVEALQAERGRCWKRTRPGSRSARPGFGRPGQPMGYRREAGQGPDGTGFERSPCVPPRHAAGAAVQPSRRVSPPHALISSQRQRRHS
jgi:hypothetical protein